MDLLDLPKSRGGTNHLKGGCGLEKEVEGWDNDSENGDEEEEEEEEDEDEEEEEEDEEE